MGLGKEQLSQRKDWGRSRPLARVKARHIDGLQGQGYWDPSERLFGGPGDSVSFLSMEVFLLVLCFWKN